MSSVNKAIIIGNVGKDPEIRETQDGKEIASFNVATSEKWKDRATGQYKEKTEWHTIVVFNENIVRVLKEYVRKGSLVCVEGQIKTRKWTDKNGADRYSTEIVLQGYNSSLQLLGSKPKEESQAANVEQELDDEIPF